jgi:hypothetical protein
MQIEGRYLSRFSRIFSPLVMDGIIRNRDSKYLRELLTQSGMSEQMDLSISLSDFFEEVYWYLFANYRNEYIYKNEIANKILLGKHSINTTNMLTEFWVQDCKADVVMINGDLTVYEIKSELDTLGRLENQIGRYQDFFEYIYVVSSKDQIEKLQEVLPKEVGIIIFTDRNTLSTYRKGVCNRENIKPEVLFNSLRKPEYLRVIKNFYGYIPDLPNTLIYRKCLEMFKSVPLDRGLELVKTELKNRRKKEALAEFISSAPKSLTAYAMSNSENKKKLRNLSAIMNKCLGEINGSSLH